MDSQQSKFRQVFQKPFLSFSSDQRRKQESNLSPTITVLNGSDNPTAAESPVPNNNRKMNTPQSQPATATIHEGFAFSMSDDHSSAASTDSSSCIMTHNDETPRHVSMHPGIHPSYNFNNQYWPQKPYEDHYTFQGVPADGPIGQALTTDEAIPIIDLDHHAMAHGVYSPHFDARSMNRMSGSSYSMSTSGTLSDVPPYEDYSATCSDAHSLCSDYPPQSSRNSWMSTTQLSPVASPRMVPQTRSELVRTQHRGQASPSPRPVMRAAPYNLEASRTKRWSTGSYAPNRRSSQYIGPDSVMSQQRLSPEYSRPVYQESVPEYGYSAPSQRPYPMACQAPLLQRNSMHIPTHLPSQRMPHPMPTDVRVYDAAPPLMSQGFFKLLHSNGSSHNFHRRYAELSDPPDLFGPLSEEQIPPPPEDMNPEDPEMMPREQDLRFEGDLYTPRWVRGHGNKREGWCGICKPGRWLVLKNSAFWYDRSFSHGISAATGGPFQEPLETRRMDGNPDVWEGLCGGCNDWIALVSSKKKGTTWFRHAYKCHNHPKSKDSVKRRRESSFSKEMNGSPAKISKTEGQRPDTPHTMNPIPTNNSTPGHQMAPIGATMAHGYPQGPAYAQTPQGFTLLSMGQNIS